VSRAPSPGHLTAEEVTELLRIVHEDKAIVVGGQSINIWAERYAAQDEVLAALGPLTSKDLDFYRNSGAAQHLAQALDGTVYVPTADDHTPNAAVVEVTLGKRRITIDFMDAILGVSNKKLCSRCITLEGDGPTSGETTSIIVMHPLDCIASRISNINGILHRSDHVALDQMAASIAVLRLFIEELLEQGEFREAQDALMELAHLIRKEHLGKDTEVKFNFDLMSVLECFLEHDKLDARWREHRLRTAIERLKLRL
jgi:hypothetical protein